MPFPEWLKKKAGRERGWVCEKCSKSFRDGWLLDCDHILSQRKGGDDTLENLQIICLLDHAIKHEENGEFHSANLIRGRIKRSNGGRTRWWIKKHR